MSQLIEPKKKIQLYKALKIGYTRDERKQAQALKKYGYVLDRELTNPRENVVAWNPSQKKLLYISQGTDPTSFKDIKTDIALGTGGIKQTVRYQEEKNALLKAQKKYGAESNQVHLVGHSLSGQLVNLLAPSGSHAITYNAAYTPGQKVRPEVTNYRTKGDVFSVFAPKETTTTLGRENAPAIPTPNALLKAHNIENLKQAKIYV